MVSRAACSSSSPDAVRTLAGRAQQCSGQGGRMAGQDLEKYEAARHGLWERSRRRCPGVVSSAVRPLGSAFRLQAVFFPGKGSRFGALKLALRQLQMSRLGMAHPGDACRQTSRCPASQSSSLTNRNTRLDLPQHKELCKRTARSTHKAPAPTRPRPRGRSHVLGAPPQRFYCEPHPTSSLKTGSGRGQQVGCCLRASPGRMAAGEAPAAACKRRSRLRGGHA